MRIDRLTAADLPAVAVMEPVLFPGEQWPISAYRQALRDPLTVALAVRDGDDLVGYGLVRRAEQGVFSIDSVGIREDHQGRGLGLALLLAEMDAGLARGARSFELQVAVTKPATIALYEGLGFRVTRTLDGYYAPGDDAFLMETGSVAAPQFRAGLERARRRVAELDVALPDGPGVV